MSTAPKPESRQPRSSARRLIEKGSTAALATLDRATGAPYVSLVTVATMADRTPVMLLSGLALHTRNLLADARASLLFAESFAADDPLALERVTVFGTVQSTSEAAARDAYLARHPAAAAYADFGDFAMYALNVERAHFIGGFGRIVELSRNDLVG